MLTLPEVITVSGFSEASQGLVYSPGIKLSIYSFFLQLSPTILLAIIYPIISPDTIFSGNFFADGGTYIHLATVKRNVEGHLTLVKALYLLSITCQILTLVSSIHF